MTDVVNVLLVVDTETLLEQSTDPSQDASHPMELSDPGCCFLAAPPHLGGGGLATAFLALDLNGGVADSAAHPPIRWRALSLTGAGDTTAVLYRIHATTASGQGGTVLAPARAFERQGQVPLPDLADGQNTAPPTYAAAAFRDYYLETRIRQPGSASIAFSFYLTRADEVGKPALAGYFRWRATITVS